MANSVASLVVQTDLLPPQTTGSLSPFPSLLGSGEEDGERGEDEEEEEGEKDMMEGGEEVVLEMMTSAVAPSSQSQDTLDQPFQCPDCGKSFKWSSRLTHHQRSHNNERPYRCNLCPKAFKGSSALLYHQRSHSGDKPYKCDDCGKAFKRSSLLQVHSSVHTGLRAFQCPYCPLTFKWSSHYQYHLRQHTGECPYTCDSCPKAFKNSSSLRRHKNVHLGLKPYICSVCHKAFTQSTNLRQHMRIHTGERPYVCGDCGRSFTHSSNLALHRNSHSHTSEGKGPQAGGLGADGGGGKVEVMVGSEEVTSSMLTDMVGFVGQEGAVGVEEVFLSHHQEASAGQGLPRLTLTHGREGMCTSRAIGTEVHVSTDTGASVLLYSCGSCSQTFSTCSELQEHQGMHADMHAGPGEEGQGQGGAGGDGGVGLVGAGHLLADFEEVVETTTVSENGHTAAELLGLTEGMDGGNVESAQAQFDLLQSFTAAVAQMPAEGGGQAGVTVATGGVTPCAYCSKSFKTSGGLTRHLAQAHPPAPPQSRSQFSCSACDRSFPLLSSLLTHQHSHTPEQRLLAEAEAEIVCPPSLSLSLPLPSSPGQAHKQGDSQGEIHVSLIAVTQEEEEGEEEEEEGGQADRDQAKPPPRSGTKSQRRGGGGKASAGGNNERPYRCSECEKSFKGSSGLRYHMRDHTGERPYRCTECGKSFKRSSLLSIHQRVHTGVRAFQCPYCPLTFKWSSHYQYHLRQHTGERPYVCKECGKSFKNTSCLRRHSQMHSGLRPHTCSVCSKSFSQTSNLKQHERTHSGERPFQCSQCHKTFTHSSNLQLHLRTHSSRKDYKCPYCSKEFVMHSYLQRHIRTHANGTALMSGGGAKEAEAAGGKGAAGGLTTATLLNPITLETTGTPGSLIVSQPALDIPLNTSQNYFMIQTASGLQLIPLSAPTPAPPPPPPPQTHSYIVLQCPSSNGSQPSLILVPAATNPAPPTTDHQALPLVQTIPGLQPVLSPAHTQIPHFQTVTQQPQQTRFIITNNNNSGGVGVGNAPITTTTPPLSSNSLLSKPILGRSTRTARTRRGRKPKAASLKAAAAASSQSGSGPGLTASTVTLTTTSTAANTTTTCSVPASLPVSTSLPATAAPPVSSSSLSGGGGAMAVSQSTSTPSSLSTMVTVTTPVTTTTQASLLPPEEAAPDGGSSCSPLEEGQGGGKQYVLCFEKEEGRREQVQLEGEGGESYVLQFEGGGSGEGGAGGHGERESFVLRFKRDGEREGGGGGDVGEVVSLLQEWGGERPEGRQTGEEGGDGESYVLHFQTETQSVDENQANSSYPQGPDNSLELSCPPTQALLPLHGPGVVFALGEETKLEQDPGESMRMIALIEGEGGGGSYSPPGGEGRDVGAGMEGIYQIEGEEGIVIIEVSTSHLRDGGMHQEGEGGETERREGKAEGGGGAETGPDKKQKSEEGVGEVSENRTTHTHLP